MQSVTVYTVQDIQNKEIAIRSSHEPKQIKFCVMVDAKKCIKCTLGMKSPYSLKMNSSRGLKIHTFETFGFKIQYDIFEILSTI